jgi:hypothetical protein
LGQISKNYGTFYPKSSQKYEFGIRDPRSGIRNKPIPDPGSRGQKGPNPRSGSATLVKRFWIALWARFCLLLTSRVRLKHQKPGRLKLSKFANILIIGFWRIASVTLFQEQSLMPPRTKVLTVIVGAIWLIIIYRTSGYKPYVH